MKTIRLSAALVGTAFFALGYLMAGRETVEFGHTLFLAGAILTAGVLISSAISDISDRD